MFQYFASPAAGQPIFPFRRVWAERAIKWPIRWLGSRSPSENLKFIRSRKTRQGHTVKMFGVGNPALVETLARLPELFLHKDCQILKLEKKIMVARLPLRIGRTIRWVYVKQHNALSFWRRLGSLFCASAALRGLSGAATLLREGYATARPIGAVEYRRWGLLIKSFFVSEEISGATTSVDYWREDLVSLKSREGQLKRRAVLRALARVFKSLHERGIYHNDLKASNILAVDKGSSTEKIFSLIDLHGVRKCFYVRARRRIKNLAQINRTLGDHLTRTEKLLFLEAYLDGERSDRRYTRNLVRRILDETDRQIARESAAQRLRARGWA